MNKSLFHRWGMRLPLVAELLLTLALVLPLLHPQASFAQVTPKVNFSCTPTSAVESLTPSCTWSTVGVVSCTASGAWSGDKALSGTEILPAQDRDVSAMLVCRTANGGAVVSWQPPTQNTNGTPLTNLAGFKVYQATTAAGLASSTPVNVGASIRSYTFTDLPEGPRVFAVTAVTTTGVESAMSAPPGTKTIASTEVSAAVPLKVDTRPKAVAVTVQ